ncbi:MAG: prephenate dehydratase [Mariniblastus sp.]
MSPAEKTLQEFRTTIDAIDRKLVRCINRRSQLAVEFSKWEKTNAGYLGCEDTAKRITETLEKNAGPIPNSALEGVYREIFNGAYFLGRATRVGYLGPQGTFSHLAASQYFGEQVDYENLRALEGVFEEVSRGHVDFGLVPIENSTGGAIIETLDSFSNYFDRVTICGEIRLAIHFSLMGNCELKDVKKIYSKGEALAQCTTWLGENLPDAERVAAQSTAASAEIAVLADPNDGVAAIGSSMAAELYKLKTLKEGVENCSNNVTRFLILSRTSPKPTGNDKTSLMFTCADRPGSLVDILTVFKRNGINLSHIEKRPSRELGSDYTFFVDMLGHAKDGQTAEILGEVRAHCKNLFVLGSFPAYHEELRYQEDVSEKLYETAEALKVGIDETDSEMISLINERAKTVIQVGEFKRKSDVPIYAPHREAAVLAKISSLNEGPLTDRTMESIYRELMSGSFALEKPLSIGFLGPEGEFSHLAAIRQFGSSVEFKASRAIQSVFDQVANDEIDYGLVPVENSSVGGINATLDSFIDMHDKLKIYGEVKLQVHFCLLANCRPEQVRKIYSKPEVFQQCRNWLSTQYPQAVRVPTESTALATKKAREEIDADPNCGVAAIGSTLAGEIYGLKPLFEAIEDRQSNITRFLILSKSQTLISGHDKTSIMFETEDRSGALVDVLDVFKRNAINLTHLEKRPSRELNWDYTFFVDLIGHREDEKIANVIGESRAYCKNLVVLGSFPASQRVL